MPNVTVVTVRDEVKKVAGVPHSRLVVYKVSVPTTDIDGTGFILLTLTSPFVINSIAVNTTDEVHSDSTYGLYDTTDNELISLVQIRPGKKMLRPQLLPNLPANLIGPTNIFIRHESGPLVNVGSIILTVGFRGPPSGSLPVDLDGDGQIDDLESQIIFNPPFETFADFMEGYNLGIQGINILD